MYTDEDLDYAIEKDVLTASSVNQFRQLMAESRETPLGDEENFRLITGFNDIFVVIACLLSLISVAWFMTLASSSASALAFALLSWGLAEYFVRKRKMAFPAIILLLTFIGGVFFLVQELLADTMGSVSYWAYLTATLAALLHWRRFRVPITVAAGAAAATGLLVSLFISVFPDPGKWLQVFIVFCGLLVFLLAMHWDASDIKRVSHRSDVAFWLHLLSAPLVIHPIFSGLGILQGDDSPLNMIAVVLLYLVMTAVSLLIDRRALMVSSLGYVLYALSTLIATYGGPGQSFAVTGVLVGASLLLLSAYWHQARAGLLVLLPAALGRFVPPVASTH
ncbi:hypothetical protein [Microbulbifer sediminum]|uniref:hypothetical protein n=1 Tax=Microbulbifer sediminum TaxID=2904250 RepID=UPI001F3DF490|nr:hypothetical protein [Microbulbifer sediminum]